MTNALEAAVDALFDYAGLFPPAELDLEAALRSYQRDLEDPVAQRLLARFVCPAASLGEAAQVWEEIGDPDSLPVTLLASGADPAAIEADVELASGYVQEGFVDLQGYEIRIDDARRVGKLEKALRSFESIDVYCEIPLTEDAEGLHDLLEAVCELEYCAKVRLGGTSPEHFPRVEPLAAFLEECVALGCPFKLTAGLHHAIAGIYPIDSHRPAMGTTRMQGFANVVAAVALLDAMDYPREVAARVLRCDDASQFVWDGDELVLGEHLMGETVVLVTDELTDARDLLVTIGSCSIAEPLADLRRLGWLR